MEHPQANAGNSRGDGAPGLAEHLADIHNGEHDGAQHEGHRSRPAQHGTPHGPGKDPRLAGGHQEHRHEAQARVAHHTVEMAHIVARGIVDGRAEERDELPRQHERQTPHPAIEHIAKGHRAPRETGIGIRGQGRPGPSRLCHKFLPTLSRLPKPGKPPWRDSNTKDGKPVHANLSYKTYIVPVQSLVFKI